MQVRILKEYPGRYSVIKTQMGSDSSQKKKRPGGREDFFRELSDADGDDALFDSLSAKLRIYALSPAILSRTA